MQKLKVKAGAVTHLTDARYFAAWGVEWLGFPITSPNSAEVVAPATVKAIKEWVDGVKIVGEFNAPIPPGELKDLIEQISLDFIQAGDSIREGELKAWEASVPVIKEVIIKSDVEEVAIESLLQQYAPYTSFFLLNFEEEAFNLDKGIPFSKEFFKKLTETYPILLEANISAVDLPGILEYLPIHGVNLKGGEEEKTGIKSFDELDEIFEAISDEIL